MLHFQIQCGAAQHLLNTGRLHIAPLLHFFFNIIILRYNSQGISIFLIFCTNIKATWSKWIFSVNHVKHWPHDAPHTYALKRSNLKNQLISNISLPSEYFSAKNNLQSLSDGNSHSLPPLAILLTFAKGTRFLNCGRNSLGPHFL